MAIVKQRDSNLELLRIVAMSMIVIYHIFVHGISPVYVGSHSILTAQSETLGDCVKILIFAS